MAVNQLKTGALLNYVILGLNAVVGIVYTPYMLRMLGQSEYGIYSLAASVIAYLSILDLGFGNAVIRYTAKFRAENKTEEQYSMFGLFTVLYSIIGLITLVAGSILYLNISTIFGETLTSIELERTEVIVMLMIVNLAFTFPLSIYGAVITAYEHFVFLRIIQIVKIILNTIVMIALLSLGYKAIAMVVVHTLFNFVVLGLNYFYCKGKIKIKVSFNHVDRFLLKEIAIYSFWIFLNVLMDRIYWSTGQFVLGAVSGTIAVSVFAVAIQLQGMYMMFSNGISGVFLPKVTAMVAKEASDAEVSFLFIRTGRLQFIIIAFILSCFIVFGKSFIRLWAGESYEESYYITIIFFVALFIPLIQNLGVIILQARNQMKFRSLLYIVIAFASLLAQIPLAKWLGGLGCALAIGGALFLGQGLIMNIYYHGKQRLNVIEFWKGIFKMSVIPVILTIVGFILMSRVEIPTLGHIILYIIGFSVIYIPLFWKFSMNRSERDLIVKPIINQLRKDR